MIKRANICHYHAEQLPGSNSVEYFSKAIGQLSQGYYFSRPVPRDEAIALVATATEAAIAHA